MTRDDLFTNIHKAIRLGLFDTITTIGATDWTEPLAVAHVGTTWRRMSALLSAHTAHEDDHILRILDPHDAAATTQAGAEHRDLDRWLGEIDAWVEAIVSDPDPIRGLALYREVALFCADYLRHIHDEETRIMQRVWELCTDEEIAATRAAFMADMKPEVLDTSLRMMLPAIDAGARTDLVRALVATAPPPAVDGALAIAHDVLDPTEADRLALLTVSVPA